MSNTFIQSTPSSRKLLISLKREDIFIPAKAPAPRDTHEQQIKYIKPLTTNIEYFMKCFSSKAIKRDDSQLDTEALPIANTWNKIIRGEPITQKQIKASFVPREKKKHKVHLPPPCDCTFRKQHIHDIKKRCFIVCEGVDYRLNSLCRVPICKEECEVDCQNCHLSLHYNPYYLEGKESMCTFYCEICEEMKCSLCFFARTASGPIVELKDLHKKKDVSFIKCEECLKELEEDVWRDDCLICGVCLSLIISTQERNLCKVHSKDIDVSVMDFPNVVVENAYPELFEEEK